MNCPAGQSGLRFHAVSGFTEDLQMLVLTRKVWEEIVIGGDIRLTVVAVQGGQVRIGISAPDNVVVDRQEVTEKRNQWFGERPFRPLPPTADGEPEALRPRLLYYEVGFPFGHRCPGYRTLPPFVSRTQPVSPGTTHAAG
jgi:carbon storage regulator